ncbi:AI-2E family transporter [Candidatus Gracilibacteria bacterium]|nr:AI-2E family transporter [Candidatus Gracilibacteria bacterium]
MVLLHLVVFVLAIFYFLKDGAKLMAYIRSLLPLKPTYRQELFTKMHDLMNSIIFGIFGAALAQAATLGLGLALTGVDNALFWSALGALFAPIPYVGIGLIWVPMVISLFIGGHTGSAIFLIIWCELLVVNVDNIVKPYLIGVRTMLHPFAVLLVIFGGIMAFGLKGLIFGPFVLTMALAFMHIYRMEYQSVLEEKQKK